MSSREDENAKPVTVKIIETVYVEADTADDFKSVVQRLTGKGAVAEPEQSSRPPASSQDAQSRNGQGHGSQHGDHKAAGGASGTRQNR
ncbi:hypothetical protein C2845_PM05G28670 [Panicum miliaceum]|uniref:VQ domain-containing protein n=1 Tax=Panicum miliaceum TaxID=4540 RepID=A0A3L6SU47_PANMI|nr:hypothetical protein C2845_PM05G28670 [Panicum miliaceum]